MAAVTAIPGATSSTYVPVSADVGQNITCTVTATNTAGNASATSAAVGPVTTLAVNNTLRGGNWIVHPERRQLMTPVYNRLMGVGRGIFNLIGKNVTLVAPLPPATEAWNNSDKGTGITLSGTPLCGRIVRWHWR